MTPSCVPGASTWSPVHVFTRVQHVCLLGKCGRAYFSGYVILHPVQSIIIYFIIFDIVDFTVILSNVALFFLSAKFP